LIRILVKKKNKGSNLQYFGFQQFLEVKLNQIKSIIFDLIQLTGLLENAVNKKNFGLVGIFVTPRFPNIKISLKRVACIRVST